MISGTAWVDSNTPQNWHILTSKCVEKMGFQGEGFPEEFSGTHGGGRSWRECSTTSTNFMIKLYQALGWEIVCEHEFGAVNSVVWKDPVQKTFEVFGDWTLSPYHCTLDCLVWQTVLVTKAINVICKVWYDWCTWDPAPACRNQLQWRALAQGLWPLTLSSQLRLTLKCSQ